MGTISVDRLRQIRTLPALIDFLRDELDWPVDVSNVDDLVFDFTPKELGLDEKYAVNIKEIKQFRPLSSKQPWGIFWVSFEKKQLPMVVLRRILGNLVIKTRAGVRRTDRPGWHLHYLLFISSYGEEQHRTLSFAHFSEDPDTHELPVLRVLGWDDQNSIMQLDRVAHQLKDHLRWPDHPDDIEAWRENWSAAFTDRYREAIRSSDELIPLLAGLASSIRNRVRNVLTAETDKGPMRRLFAAVRSLLIHDMTEDGFADMYAQTVAYGLLSARFSRPSGLTAQNLVQLTSVSNPFLENLLENLFRLNRGKFHFDVDEVGINDVLDLLRNTNMEAIKAAFSDKNPSEDPVIRFYEGFLKEYDPQQRVKRGVFFTPRPVVSYIVRSVHELLQTEFGLADGLASIDTWADMQKRFPDLKVPAGAHPDDPFVCILDPATGTGTFLFECIEVIERTMKDKWCRELGKKSWGAPEIIRRWTEYVPKHLLPRLYGYELMMAPYSIAHLKLALKLGETGYQFRDGDRLHIYLTNSLEPPSKLADSRLADMFGALAAEAQDVNEIKSNKRFTAVIGNPPYSSLSSNASRDEEGQLTFIGGLIEDYKLVDGHELDETNPKWLHDDYIKFLRFGQWLIGNIGWGILGFITNHSYVDNPTFRGMRYSLFSTFDNIWLLNLHGNVKKTETAPDGSKDNNVFDIQQGVAITIATKADNTKYSGINYHDLWGSRDFKYKVLSSSDISISDIVLTPTRPSYYFVPQNVDLRSEYELGWKISEVFTVNSAGVVSARDGLTIQWTANESWAIVCDFVSLSEEKAREKYNLGKDARDWRILLAQNDVKNTGLKRQLIVPILYRPFDIRYIYYTGHSRGFICMPRHDVMRHMIGNSRNIALLWTRPMSPNYEFSVFSTRYVADQCVVGNKTAGAGISYEGPLYVYPAEGEMNLQLRTANMNQDFISDIVNRIGLPFDINAVGRLPDAIGPQDLLDYCYAVFHSPSYRSRYSAFLKTEIPRLHVTSSIHLFCALASLGHQLVSLHLMESPLLDSPKTKIIGDVPTAEVEKVTFSKDTVWIDKSGSQGFVGVPETIWNYNIGGYQVCEKWLKDRKGRRLSADDIAHYQKIVVAISETIRIMAEIDKVIDAHGGWPGAFISGKDS